MSAPLTAQRLAEAAAVSAGAAASREKAEDAAQNKCGEWEHKRSLPSRFGGLPAGEFLPGLFYAQAGQVVRKISRRGICGRDKRCA